MHCTHENKAISSKWKSYWGSKLKNWKKTFDVETLAEENVSENSPKENTTCAEEYEKKKKKEKKNKLKEILQSK